MRCATGRRPARARRAPSSRAVRPRTRARARPRARRSRTHRSSRVGSRHGPGSDRCRWGAPGEWRAVHQVGSAGEHGRHGHDDIEDDVSVPGHLAQRSQPAMATRNCFTNAHTCPVPRKLYHTRVERRAAEEAHGRVAVLLLRRPWIAMFRLSRWVSLLEWSALARHLVHCGENGALDVGGQRHVLELDGILGAGVR